MIWWNSERWITEPAGRRARFIGAMTKYTHLTRCAGAAIAAALAFGSTPVLAQGVPTAETAQAPAATQPGPQPAPQPAQPAPATPPVTTQSPATPAPGSGMDTITSSPGTPVTDTASAGAATSPGIVLPPETISAPQQAAPTGPVVQQLPPPDPEPVVTEAEPVAEPAPVAAETPAPAAAPVSEPETVATSALDPAASADAPLTDAQAPLAATTGQPMAGAEFEAAPASVTDPAQPAAAESGQAGEGFAWIAGVLGALGLGGLALLALRRRNVAPRKAPQPRATAAPQPKVVPAPAAPAMHPAYAAGVTPMASQRPAAPRPARAGTGLSNSGAAIALPRSAPANFEEREALLRRMVAARPDRANPFRSPKARRRRARLIMQSLGRKFDREPNIDLSQYPENWPELARRDYATAA